VRGDEYSAFVAVELQADMPFQTVRTRKDWTSGQGRHAAEAAGVVAGLHSVEKVQVVKVVHVYFVLQCYSDAITTKFDRLDFSAETELSYTATEVVIPQHHLVRRVARTLPPAHQGNNVAAEQHFHDADPSTEV